MPAQIFNLSRTNCGLLKELVTDFQPWYQKVRMHQLLPGFTERLIGKLMPVGNHRVCCPRSSFFCGRSSTLNRFILNGHDCLFFYLIKNDAYDFQK
jgi:hypothetical protein